MTTDGGPAFPSSASPDVAQSGGMSLRDHFAARALSVIIESKFRMLERGTECDASNEATAEDAYAISDAMLAERAKARA